MELNYGFLYGREIENSLGKLFSAKFHGELLKKINLLQRGLQKEHKVLSQLYEVIVKTYAVLDENNNPKIGEYGNIVIKEGKDQEFKDKAKELMNKKFEIKGYTPINVNQLYNSSLELSSHDIQNIEPILCGLDS